MLFGRPRIAIPTGRLVLRLPETRDHGEWARLRRDGTDFLSRWEPVRDEDHLTHRAFRNRVAWAKRSFDAGRAIPLFLIRREDGQLLGGITLDNIRRGPSQSASIGYWIGEEYARQGYMLETVMALVDHAFRKLDLSRIEAGCLPENTASRALLEKAGFKYEGVAQSYLQIAGRWRNHVLYSNLRGDRRGKTDAG
jgi:[ribosomal protein S5]-alanine N-acetyltransferase